MATAAFLFNIAKGKIARYADLPDPTDSLIVVWVKNTGLESDAILKDYDTLAAILAGSNDECDYTGYTRRTLTGVTALPDDSTDKMVVDAADPASYTNTGTTQIAGAALLCYVPSTGAADSAIVPLANLLVGTLSFDQNVLINVAFAATGIADAA
jgi:hypothetical protein